jgi:hypothetical protein
MSMDCRQGRSSARRTGSAAVLVAVVLGTAAPARAQRWEDATARREALFDIAVAAMAHGDLDLAERAFLDAAAVPGDPVRSAVSASFATRVRHLKEKRQHPVVVVSPADVTLRATPAPPRPAPEVSQGSSLVAISTVLGAALYGWTVPMAIGVPFEESRVFLGVYMVTASASFLGPYLATRGSAVSPAQVDLAFYGGTRGAWHGVLAAAALTGDVNLDERGRAWACGVTLGSAGEMLAGYLLADDGRLTTGQTHTMAALGDLGLLWGVSAGYFFRFNHRDTPDEQARAMAGSSLLGAGLGLTGGYLLGRRRENTWGDAEVLRLGGLLGGLTGLGVADAFRMELDFEHRLVNALAVGGSALGAATADRLLRPLDLTTSQAILVDLGTAAGALITAGFTYLLTPDAAANRIPFVLTAAIGGVGGFGLSYWGLLDRSRSRGRNRDRAGRGPDLALVPMLSLGGERGAALAGHF